MIDHAGFAVADYPRSRAFYERVLAPLGYAVVMEVTERETGPGDYQGCGFGPPRKPAFWVGTGARPGTGTHVAFVAPTAAPSMPSMPRPWLRARPTTAPRACARTTIPITTPRS